MKYKEQIVINSLKQARNNANLTQQEVADKLGFCSTNRISHWELGKAIPSIINLFRLSAIYDVCPCDLYGEVWDRVKEEKNKKIE